MVTRRNAIELSKYSAVARSPTTRSRTYHATHRPATPRPRITFGKWWVQAEKLAKLERVKRRGYHSLRRQFATELKDTPLRALAHLGGWKDTTTLLKCYQQPDEGTQRRALESRRKLKVGGLE